MTRGGTTKISGLTDISSPANVETKPRQQNIYLKSRYLCLLCIEWDCGTGGEAIYIQNLEEIREKRTAT